MKITLNLNLNDFELNLTTETQRAQGRKGKTNH